jgi:tryptophan synthase alpha chain
MEKTIEVVTVLSALGVDFIELGMPYSDPLADGKTIQASSEVAIKKGMTLKKYFEIVGILQSKEIVPIVYMGYLNQILQFGVEAFCHACKKAGISCVIVPDLPTDIYEKEFKTIFEKHNLLISFLVTPTTSVERIRKIESLTTGFIYVVSSNAITGKTGEMDPKQLAYLKHIKSLKFSKPTIVGFGIHDKKTFESACQFANGAIIGSEFIRNLTDDTYSDFIKTLKAKS